ncbi:MAG TPA: HAD-IA family hydrolase, partial [Bacteroidota bacterium]
PALKYLSKRYLSYQVGFIKPMPGFYEYILRHETVPPGDMLFIDDIAENIGAAQQAGMQGHIFQSAVELRRLLSNLKTL